MKRGTDTKASNDTKRRRSGDPPTSANDPFDPSLERRATDIYRYGTDGTGFLKGKVVMKWGPMNGRLRVLFATQEGSPPSQDVRFEVNFAGDCSKHFRVLSLHIRDEFKLCLKGASVRKTCSSHNALQMTLQYEDGVTIKYLHSKDESLIGKVIDLWSIVRQERKEPEPEPHDWYATPAVMQALPLGHTDVVTPVNDQILTIEPEEARLSNIFQRSDPTIPAVWNQGVHGREQNTVRPAPIRADRHSTETGPLGCTSPPITSVIGSGIDGQQGKRSSAIADRSTHTARDQATHILHKYPANLPHGDVGGTSTPLRAPVRADSTKDLSVKKLRKQGKARLRKTKQQSRKATGEGFCGDAAGSGLPPIADPQAHSREGTEDSSASGMKADTSLSVSSHSDTTSGTALTGSMLVDDGSSANPSVHQTSVALVSAPPTECLTAKISETSVPAQSSAFENDASYRSPAPVMATTTPKIPLGSESKSSDPALSRQAGFHSEYGYYTPLNEVQDKKSCNVVGVVTFASSVSPTYTNEFKTNVDLVDPSNHNVGEFSINCFGKVENCLPKPKKGDILLIRQLQGDFYRKPRGTAPSYKGWTWAIFDPLSGKVAGANFQDSLIQMTFEPTPLEVDYCVRLWNWYKDVYPDAMLSPDLGTVHQIEDSFRRSRSRVHRLICDASPQAEPDGFFDCTVEVLYGKPTAQDHVYSIYVTDYTRNPAITPIEADWCPPQLADKVLKVELWLDASQLGPSLESGGYYFMGNNRMKVSSGGYMEATISAKDKIKKLDEDELEGQPHLQALLQRKRDWEAQVEASGGAELFPHKLIEDAEGNRHFRCTVEVLSLVHRDEQSYLYVTDYTSRSDLVPVAATLLGVANLEDRVVRIVLFDGQIETAKHLEPGDFVSIRNLRLKPSGGTSQLAGRLGGDQRLISKLQTHTTANEHLKALLRRKEEWETRFRTKGRGLGRNYRRRKAAEVDTPLESRVPDVRTEPEVSPGNRRGLKTIKEVVASPRCPNKFRIRSRIIDFYPNALRDFTVMRCTKCGDDVPRTRRICTACDDAMDEDTYVRPFYQFWFRVQDQEGSQLELSVCDAQCSLLKSVQPTNFHADQGALEEFTRHLKPLLVDLFEEREGICQRRLGDSEFDPNTPDLDLTIGSWPLGDEDEADAPSRGYLLMHHELLSDHTH
ncbi:hypothetical protein AcW1_006221 [Taiwanofungus camphoratus]|nr:hypothetical protein AcV5_006539 [Antrodia cinnamomea]KAI0949888.1 hypothetical protein AcV7_008527 [Antrodia cinnamomea]KAI0958024.1 hypothetical protein AcW1_006221 [Antrodia cinnamomea]